MNPTHGISAKSRTLLESLHRAFSGPFSVPEAAPVMAMNATRSRRLLAHLAAGGWLSRIRRDAYVTVPLGTKSAAASQADPWLVAAKLFAPCYIGGWSAGEHWGLTEQIFHDVLVVTSRRLRSRSYEIQGTRFIMRVAGPKRLFGTRPVWRGRTKVLVSDPSRTIIDLFDDPSIGGGMRHVADMTREYFSSSERNDALLVEYARKIGNRTIFKRLGYVAERLGIAAPKLLAACLKHKSAGLSPLEPGGRSTGRIVKRWNLRVNVTLEASRTSA